MNNANCTCATQWQCQVQSFCRIKCLTCVRVENERLGQHTCACAAFLVELWICFKQWHSWFAHVDVQWARYKKQRQTTLHAYRCNGKAIQLASALSQYLQGKHIDNHWRLYTCMYVIIYMIICILPPSTQGWRQPIAAERQPCRCHNKNTIAPPKVVCHKKETTV